MRDARGGHLLVPALILAWGLSFPSADVGLRYMPPLLLVGLRCTAGGLALLTAALLRRERLRGQCPWATFAWSTLLNVVLGATLGTVAVAYLGAGAGAALVYVQPLLVGPMAYLWLGESLGARRLLALLLGAGGVVAIALSGGAGGPSPLGAACGLAAGAAWAGGTVVLKRAQRTVAGLWLIAVQFLAGGAAVMATGSLLEGWSAVRWSMPLVLSLGYSALVAVALGWVIWARLLATGEAGRVSALIFCVPAVSVAAAAVVLRQWPGPAALVGIGAILVSLWWAESGAGSRARAPAAAGSTPSR